MVEFTPRQLYLVKKALAVAVLATQRQDGPLQARTDMSDMKSLLDQLIESDRELIYFARSARSVIGAD